MHYIECQTVKRPYMHYIQCQTPLYTRYRVSNGAGWLSSQSAEVSAEQLVEEREAMEGKLASVHLKRRFGRLESGENRGPKLQKQEQLVRDALHMFAPVRWAPRGPTVIMSRSFSRSMAECW